MDSQDAGVMLAVRHGKTSRESGTKLRIVAFGVGISCVFSEAPLYVLQDCTSGNIVSSDQKLEFIVSPSTSDLGKCQTYGGKFCHLLLSISCSHGI